jgi:hypothetical protein
MKWGLFLVVALLRGAVARPFSEVPQSIKPPVTWTCTDGKETSDVLIMRKSGTFKILGANGSYASITLLCSGPDVSVFFLFFYLQQ